LPTSNKISPKNTNVQTVGKIRRGKHREDLTRMRPEPTHKGMTQALIVGKIRGGNTGEISNNENCATPHKGMIPPSTQNLKALGLWVFFLICCLTISFLLNVGLRLTLGYLTISPSSESPFHIGTLPLKHEYITNSPLVLPFTLIQDTHSLQGLNYTCPSRKPSALIPLVGKSEGGNTEEISQE